MKIPKTKRIVEVEFAQPTRGPDNMYTRTFIASRMPFEHSDLGITYGNFIWPWHSVSRVILADRE